MMITMIDEAREEIGRLNGEIGRLHGEIGRLHGELAASMRSVIDERDEARRERDVAQASLVEALAQRDDLRAKRDALEVAYHAANELREAIRRERDEARMARDEARSIFGETLAQKDDLRAKRDVLEVEYYARSEECTTLRRERDEARAELASEKARFVSILTAQNESCCGDQSRLVAELRRVADDEHALTSTHAAAMTAAVVIQHLEATVAEYAARIDGLVADRSEERRKMAWDLVLMVARSGVNPESEWPTAKAWAVVDAFLAAEVNR